MVPLFVGFILQRLLFSVALANPLIVDLPFGKIRGLDNGHFYSFEGIPYAEPPIGELRFEPPKPYTQTWDGIRDGTKPNAECPQWNQYIALPNKLTGNEDCLTVSILKPKNESRTTFPVLVSIYGGAFAFGGAMQDGAKPVMESGNFIVVKIAHRVGILGFLSTGDAELPGNNGLKDQRLALRWIKANIAHFGGDPEKIMFIGFSSGAISLHLQMMNADLKDLIKGGISMSGNAFDAFSVQPHTRRFAFELGRNVGCGMLNNSRELKQCLKTKDAIYLTEAIRRFLVYQYVPCVPIGPVVEPKDSAEPFMTEHPADIIKNGKSAQIPWLVSYTTEDGIYNAAYMLLKDHTGKEAMRILNNRWYDLAPYFLFYRRSMETVEEMDNKSRDLRQQYMGNESFSIDNYFKWQRMITDGTLKNGTQESLELHRRYSQSPLYTYVFDNPAYNSFGQLLAERNDLVLGTGHGDDYFLVMNNIIREPLRPDEKLIAWHLVKMMERFIETDVFVYDNCTFPDNAGQVQFKLVVINRFGCSLMTADDLPDTVSDNLPPIPIVKY